MKRAPKHVVRVPLVVRVIGTILLLAPLLTLRNAMTDPTIFSENGASVPFQWTVTVVMSIGAVLVLVMVWRSRLVVEPDRITRYRYLRKPVRITRDGAWSITVEPDPERADVAGTYESSDEPAPTIVVVGAPGRTLTSDRAIAEARVLFPCLLGWTVDDPRLMTDQRTRQMFAAYERALLGRAQQSPYA
ncbi:hypothetical protein [Sanguibacter sp. 25GB23B1]|uniref:hypothetical protein n=1 Tax=unclassified Sanguibacter TaxID=2645534 RepID=UPI0032AEA30E